VRFITLRSIAVVMVTVMDSLTIFLVPLLQAFQPDRGYGPSIAHEFL